MLWSLTKILVFVACVAALAFGAAQLLEMEGGVQITFNGVERTFGPLQTAIAFVVLVAALYIVLKVLGLIGAVLRFINGDETALSRYFVRNRERKGFDALSEGMMALASGEGRLAMSKASKAERYLRKPELTNLITAQAAEMVGDTKKADQVYKELLQNDQTRFVGVRGIMRQKLAAGDTDTALALAEKAFALKPKHEETQDVLLRLQAEKEDWTGARKTLTAKLKHGSLPRDVHKRRDAVLALSEAKAIVADDSTIEVKEASIEANRLSPDLIPAAVLAADSYNAAGEGKYAARVLKKAWGAHPHPDLAAAFARIAPEETPAERLKRFKALTRVAADHAETKMLLAELHIAAEDFPAALAAMGDLAESNATTRSLTILAAIERGQGASDDVVRGWLTKALTAPRGPQWVCDNCQNIHAEWAPTCSNCGAFDTLAWRTPTTSDATMPSSTEMLPLLVGTPSASDVDDAEVIDEAPTGVDALEKY